MWWCQSHDILMNSCFVWSCIFFVDELFVESFRPGNFVIGFVAVFFFVLYLPCGVGTGKLIFNGIGKLTCITGCNIHQEKDACSQPWWEIITSLYTVFGRSTTAGGFSSAFEDLVVDFDLLGFNHQLCDLLFSPLARLSCFIWIGF